MQHYFQLLSLSLNFCLCLDIVLTMGNPFSPHDRRMKFYLLSSMFSAGLLSGLTLNSRIVSQLALPVDLQQINHLEVKAALGVIFLSCYILYAIFSVAYAYRLNTRPGFSAGIRGAFIRNHLLYVLAYVLTWVPYMGMCFYIMYTSHSLLMLSSESRQTAAITAMAEAIVNTTRTWYYFTIFISMLTGLLMACVRIREPMF